MSAGNTNFFSNFHNKYKNQKNHQKPLFAPSAEPSLSAAFLEQQKKTNSRHCEEMKIYFLDQYLDFLTYLDERKKRTAAIQDEMLLVD